MATFLASVFGFVCGFFWHMGLLEAESQAESRRKSETTETWYVAGRPFHCLADAEIYADHIEQQIGTRFEVHHE